MSHSSLCAERPIVELPDGGRYNESSAMSWLNTFARFRPGETPLIGPIKVRVADWSKPQPGRAPMFKNPVLERLSVAHPALPFSIYAPSGLFLLWHAWSVGYSVLTVVAT